MKVAFRINTSRPHKKCPISLNPEQPNSRESCDRGITAGARQRKAPASVGRVGIASAAQLGSARRRALAIAASHCLNAVLAGV
ncbi:hypothetical protein EVAR_44114_1 [Eumeta japonica]|uniref:Uncharacterized protein n=1 Tax=Eumeta variegata TaxID=151549 RepID=A0A4C2A2A0_EUMVA|nr:hypothetical protein EVAR_44114_1 [Eumeta japonica]